MKAIQSIFLCLFLLLRPLGAVASTLQGHGKATPPAPTSPTSTPTAPTPAQASSAVGPTQAADGDDTADDADDDDDDDDDSDSAPNSVPQVAAPGAQDQDDDADDDDNDDDDEDDDSDVTISTDGDIDDAMDEIAAAEDAGKAISGNATLASDYILRGLTQTDHAPAIQGGFDWTHPIGTYFGVWGSNVHFPGEIPSLEMDTYGGYTRKFGDDWRGSLGLTYLAFFADEGRNSFAFPAKAEWKAFSLEITYSPRWAGLNGDSWYFLGGWTDTLPQLWDVTLGGYAGFSTFSADADAPDYFDFRVTASHKFLEVDWGIAGVFVSKQEINDANGGPRVIFSIAKTF